MTVSGATSATARLTNIRVYRKALGVRFPAALLVLGLSLLSKILPREAMVVIGWYSAATFILAVGTAYAIEQRAFRLIANAIDILAISALVALADAISRGWLVLLYVFPITAVSRYLGFKWSLFVSLAAAGFYTYTSVSRPLSVPETLGVVAVFLILPGVALNASKLASSRIRFENKINHTIDEIHERILSNKSLGEVMDSVLQTAMKLTRSDLTALILAGGDGRPRFFAATGPLASKDDIPVARRILEKHYETVERLAPNPLSLMKRPFLAALAKLQGKEALAEPAWAGHVIPIMIGERFFGILGVLSRHSVHYTNEDLEKLKSLQPLIVLAQQNAHLSQQLAARSHRSAPRLQLLYQIGRQLQEHEGSATVFESVVKLVAEHVGSEEAALFIPEERGDLLRKVAVAAPENLDALRALEQKEGPESLTGRVFKGKGPIVENNIAESEPHAADYSKQLPSGITKHYLGVPVLIGTAPTADARPLGVIRVLNKKASHYSVAAGTPDLDPEGFIDDELELLTAIATYIAGAMRNAMFIEKSRHFEELIYKSPDAIIVIDRDGYVRNFNEVCEGIWKMSESQAIGRPVADFYESEEHAHEIGRALWKAPRHTIHSYNALVKDFDGNIIPIRISANLLLDKDEHLVSSIGVFKDARPMIDAENARVEKEKLAAIGSMAQAVGHDMKHDLGAILGFVNTLQNGHPSESNREELHWGILSAANGILNKLQNMLMAAKVRPPEPQIIGVAGLMTEFEAGVRFRATVAEVDFIVTPPAADVAISAEPEQMRQVFANLFGNSLNAIAQASGEDGRRGRITFTSVVDGETVRITWCDNGGGMSEETRERLFTPFFTTKRTGSGLGLFITKGIIDNHSGTISVTVTGDGTCFQIVLPLDVDPTELDSGAPQP
jgi:PAS domain S-box-containing protein